MRKKIQRGREQWEQDEKYHKGCNNCNFKKYSPEESKGLFKQPDNWGSGSLSKQGNKLSSLYQVFYLFDHSAAPFSPHFTTVIQVYKRQLVNTSSLCSQGQCSMKAAHRQQPEVLCPATRHDRSWSCPCIVFLCSTRATSGSEAVRSSGYQCSIPSSHAHGKCQRSASAKVSCVVCSLHCSGGHLQN